ncbi:BC1881 family protein [Shouchella clausii]|uniref:BC1881 family protein n=1 Tax=Shouchella clausii TaxID=79880 RepID=UPI001C735FD7|nr:BC1881 family protein [Shouchella clausii]MBX0320274.1 BC1881 family protein [Shouchella clausii]
MSNRNENLTVSDGSGLCGWPDNYRVEPKGFVPLPNVEDATTKQLVDELVKRKGVKEHILEVHRDKGQVSIFQGSDCTELHEVEGPARVLVVTD